MSQVVKPEVWNTGQNFFLGVSLVNVCEESARPGCVESHYQSAEKKINLQNTYKIKELNIFYIEYQRVVVEPTKFRIMIALFTFKIYHLTKNLEKF